MEVLTIDSIATIISRIAEGCDIHWDSDFDLTKYGTDYNDKTRLFEVALNSNTDTHAQVINIEVIGYFDKKLFKRERFFLQELKASHGEKIENPFKNKPLQ